MEKENSIADSSETPESTSSVDSSIDNLTLCAGNLSLNNGEGSSLGSTNSLVFYGETSSRKPQEIVSDFQETWFENSNSKPILTPLYPQTIWEINAASNGGRDPPLGSNLQLSLPDFCCDINNQERIEDSATMMQNQENPFGGKLEGHSFLLYAANEEGSRSLQDILMLKRPEITSQILERVTASLDGIPVLYYLMLDPFGWHVCAKLIDSCNEKQLGLIVEKMTQHQELFINLSNSIYASKFIKKLIKLLKRSPLISFLITNLYLGFYQLMIDRIGAYVITYCLDNLDIKQNVLLYEAAILNCLQLATHEIGCISLNNFIDKIQGKHRHRLLELISSNAVFLSQDPSGNHVVQKVLGLENPIFTGIIGNMLRGHYARLSLQKWGSHVVEKCLKSTAMYYAVEDLINSSSNQLIQVARDQFGNYVIQRALKITKKLNSPLYLELLRSLQPHLNTLRYGYGRNIINLIASGVPINEA